MIKKTVNYYKSKNRIVEGFITNSRYLKSGEYIFDESFTYIYLKDSKTSALTIKMFKSSYQVLRYDNEGSLLKVLISNILKRIFLKKLVIDKKIEENIFFGNVYLPATQGKKGKIFDLIDNKVLSLFDDKLDFDKKIQSYRYFNDFFPIPKIDTYDNENLLVIEECINYKTNVNWNKIDRMSVIEDIFFRYISYFKVVIKENNYTKKIPMEVVEDLSKDIRFITSIKNNIADELLETKIPFVKLHGDLWTSNILINNLNSKQIYYIDWEHSKNYVFFYDFFFLMWNEVIHNQDYSYIDDYFSGQYNAYFEKIFALFNMEFQDEYKLDYFNIFFLVQFKERWGNSNNNFLNTRLDQYYALVTKYKK
jgi:hypothetical protein